MDSVMMTVVVMSVVVIICTSLVLAIFHIVLMRLCKRRNANGRGGSMSIVIEPSALGLDKRILNTIPILFYSGKTRDVYGINQGEQCVICLAPLSKGDSVRWLPLCAHVFHVPCLDNWFHAHSNCPLCRSPVRLHLLPNPIPIPRTRSGGFLCHCNQLVFPIQGLSPRDLIKAGIHRSLSMDHSYVVIDLRDPLSASSYTSYPPLSKIDFVLSRLYQPHSNTYPQHVSGIPLPPRSSLHALTVPPTLTNHGGILPY